MDASLSGSYCWPATYIPALAEMVCPGLSTSNCEYPLRGGKNTLEEVKPIKEVSGAWVTTLI